jgi:hypothetical protein
VLEIVTADSGKPVPNVGLEYWRQEGPQHRYYGSLQSTRFGVCQVPVARNTATALQIVSHVDGIEAYPVEVKLNPELMRAVVTRSRDSLTAASGRPTITMLSSVLRIPKAPG